MRFEPTKRPNNAAAASELSRAIDRVAAEWRHLLPDIELRISSPWSAIAQSLQIDRGTAQRLVKLARSPELTPKDLKTIPGAKAWAEICDSLSTMLGKDHYTVRRLELACDVLHHAVQKLGGSYAAAARAVEELEPHNSESDDQICIRKDAVDAYANLLGYRIALRYNLFLMRPSQRKSNRIDIAMANCMLGCTGRTGAASIAVQRYGVDSEGQAVAAGGEASVRQFNFIQSGTSSPKPSLYSSGDDVVQTHVLDPEWVNNYKSLDLSFLHSEPDAQDSPWLSPPYCYDTEGQVRHPVDRLIEHRMYHHDIHRDAVVKFGVYACRKVQSVPRPWFERMPHDATLVRQPYPFVVEDSSIFPSQDRILHEVFDLLKWDAANFHSYITDMSYPIPLAWHSFELQRFLEQGQEGNAG